LFSESVFEEVETPNRSEKREAMREDEDEEEDRRKIAER
jgi:hypothetical protein